MKLVIVLEYALFSVMSNVYCHVSGLALILCLED